MRDVLRGAVRRSVLSALLGLAVLGLSAPGAAVPVVVSHTNGANCDVLSVPAMVEELGENEGFLANDQIFASASSPAATACADSDTAANNVQVTIHNQSGVDFAALWYVADAQTSLSNADGLVNGQAAFRIDASGDNAPLVFESMIADGIFQAGEAWDFLIDDYLNTLGTAADAFFSTGVGDGSPLGPSSGSIIAMIAPEPGTGLLVGLGLAAASIARRRPRRRA